MNKARLSISMPTYGCGKERIRLSIKDDASGLEVIELEIPLDNFARALTGRAELKADISRLVSAGKFNNLGLKKETKRLSMDIPEGINTYSTTYNDNMREAMQALTPAGWSIWSDGLTTQQRTRGKHDFVICRYV